MGGGGGGEGLSTGVDKGMVVAGFVVLVTFHFVLPLLFFPTSFSVLGREPCDAFLLEFDLRDLRDRRIRVGLYWIKRSQKDKG